MRCGEAMLCVSMLALCLSATAVTALVPPPGVDDGVGAAARVSGATLAAARAEAVAHVEKLATRLDGVRVPGLRQVFNNTYRFALDQTVDVLDDGTVFIRTGGGGRFGQLMWLRDAMTQMHALLPLAARPTGVATRAIVGAALAKAVQFVLNDPFANAFNAEPLYMPMFIQAAGGYTAMRYYEVDQLCYVVWMAAEYWRATGVTSHFDAAFRFAISNIVVQLRWLHLNLGSTFYRPPNQDVSALNCSGLPQVWAFANLTWTPYRPSDDPARLTYNVAQNAFAVVALELVEEIATTVYHDARLASSAASLAATLESGVEAATTTTAGGARVYGYETDGRGTFVVADDANYPNLLGLPYFGYVNPQSSSRGEFYGATRKFVLSSSNPNYYVGGAAAGLGSNHTGPGMVWPLGLVMQGMTADTHAEALDVLATLVNTTAGTMLMHESFNASQPAQYTRAKFGWANAFFAEFVETKVLPGSVG